ncbi:MAG TPA: response regulator [Usitatibacter sp.]|nr:response regulator [Usitatibacter sp.]
MSTASEDVYAITDRGTNELKGGATTLTAHDLEVLVLVDGRRNGSAIASLAKGADAPQVEAVLRKLVAGGFIRTAEPTPNEGFDYFFSSAPSASEPTGEAMRRAAQEAASGAAALRQNGYYVSIARRAKGATQAARKLTVLVIEDEPLVAKFMKVVVETEGHVVRMAANREAIVAQLRQAPLPDIVILDLMLPDITGFDVLQRMKSHPALAEVPVVIVTGQATRESVVNGLAFGADGYFTKPFEIDVLLRGMKAVLGQLAQGR